jgi:hypothetical protein
MDPSLAALGFDQTGQSSGTGTGQQGHAPLLAGSGGTVTDAVNSVWDWLNTPFTAPMSPVGIAMIVGAIFVAIILWNFVLYHVRIAAETI